MEIQLLLSVLVISCESQTLRVAWFSILNMGEDLDNRLSAFKMRSPLSMKGIYDFRSLPSIFPDTYFETLCCFLLSLLEYKHIPFCSRFAGSSAWEHVLRLSQGFSQGDMEEGCLEAMERWLGWD